MTTTRENKKRVIAITLSLQDFSAFEVFKSNISVCRINERYSCIIQVNFTHDKNDISEWRTLDKQIKFIFSDQQEFEQNTISLYTHFLNRLEQIMEYYSLKEDNINEIRILLFKVEYNNYITKIKFDEKTLGSKKELINIFDTRNKFNKTLPLSVDLKELGEPLYKEYNTELLYILLKDGTKFDILSKLKMYDNYNEEIITKNSEYYEYKINGVIHIVVVNKKNNIRYISVYNLVGTLLYNTTDTLYDKYTFSRQINNVTSYINDQKGIYKKEINQSFQPVKASKLNNYQKNLTVSDYRIGTLDTETYIMKNNINQARVYCLGFYTNNDLNIFYVNEDLDSDSLIWNCLDSMLREKYSGYTFYVHNLGKFDITFILKVVLNMCDLEPDKYKYKPLFRDGKILSLSISRKTNNKTYTIKLVDSLNILNGKLSDICKTFQVEVTKGTFPYKFVNENTIFYKGIKPEYKYYEDITVQEYNKIENNNWSTEEETRKYIEKDLISLYLAIEKFHKMIWLNYQVHVNNCLTISSVSMEIFLRKYYKDNIPLITNRSVYTDIRNSYYGGITEVYKPYGKDLYYYDVNSLYPFAVFDKPMPGVECKYIDNININLWQNKDIFGFFYCEIKTSDKYIGLIPVRDHNNSVIMPLGIIKGWYFSEELKFAMKYGYDIKIIHGYEFARQYNTFKNYISEFYNIKKTSKDKVMKAIAKSLLNNLLGRFGLEIDKPITQIVTEDEFSEIVQYRKIKGDIHYIGERVLFTSVPNVSKEICDDHDVDYKTILNNKENINAKSDQSKDNLNDVSVAISSAVTSYARIHMNKIKLDILENGGSIYYTDTDSIVTDKKLDDNMIGTELGQLKLEHQIVEAYFLSNKAYCLKLKDDTTVIKLKGYNRKDVTIKDFEEMYKGVKIEKTRDVSVRNYSGGFTLIKQPRTVHFSIESYRKRDKVFEEGRWVDTKPLVVSQPKRLFNTNTKNYVDINNKYFEYKSTVYVLIINIVIILAIVILMITFAILGYVQIYHNHNVDNLPIDYVNNICVNVYDEQDNTEYFNIFDKFIKLLFPPNKQCSLDNNNINILNNALDHKHVAKLQNHSNETFEEVVRKSPILTLLQEHYYNNLDIMNQELRDEISELKILNMEHRISRLDNERLIKEVVDDLIKLGDMQNKLSSVNKSALHEIELTLAKIDSTKNSPFVTPRPTPDSTPIVGTTSRFG